MLGGMRSNERSRTVAELSARVAENLGLGPAGGIPPRKHIVGLVDEYVAMTARMPNDDALWALWRLAGERYAPKLVDALIEVAAGPHVSTKLHAWYWSSIALTVVVAGCGAGAAISVLGTSGAGASSPASNGTSLATEYRAAHWSSGVTVSFSGTCSMTLTTTGVPPYHSDYYLAPVSPQYPNSVAVTPVSNTEMAVTPYLPANLQPATATFNVCPAKAATTTATNMGAIGYMISGEAIFNPYEANGAATPAMSDNVSYSFTTGGGVAETASFIDACNSHPTPIAGGYMWHHHGIPSCLVAQLDGSSGPSHLIGIALDGFPIYGGRDINGNTIATSQLDACNGITSPTPEFPSGVYHYVLPIGVTGKQSSLNCYSGTVSQSQLALATKYYCGLDAMNRRLQAAARRPAPAHHRLAPLARGVEGGVVKPSAEEKDTCLKLSSMPPRGGPPSRNAASWRISRRPWYGTSARRRTR